MSRKIVKSVDFDINLPVRKDKTRIFDRKHFKNK